MKLQDLTIKTVLAGFVVSFGMAAVVFVKMPDMALGALIGYISVILGYFFGSSTGSVAKDKMIQDLNVQSIAGGQVPPTKDEK
jgi:hydrogenase/urease accessory protein HupE